MTGAWFLQARYSLAREAYRLSYDAARMLEDDEGIAETLLDWGRACIEQGDYPEAQEHLEESLRLFETHAGDPLRAADVRLALGRVAVEVSQFDQAESWLLEAQQVFEEGGDQQRLARFISTMQRSPIGAMIWHARELV
jgi:tetratricopeptide (TPR) repeat protein